MTETQSLLLENHREVAQTACGAKTPCFWVLDLTDPMAFRIAAQFQPADVLLDKRDATVAIDQIPAITITTDITALNAYRCMIMKTAPVPAPKDGFLYIVVCTDNRMLIASHPTLFGPMGF